RSMPQTGHSVPRWPRPCSPTTGRLERPSEYEGQKCRCTVTTLSGTQEDHCARRWETNRGDVYAHSRLADNRTPVRRRIESMSAIWTRRVTPHLCLAGGGLKYPCRADILCPDHRCASRPDEKCDRRCYYAQRPLIGARDAGRHRSQNR